MNKLIKVAAVTSIAFTCIHDTANAAQHAPTVATVTANPSANRAQERLEKRLLIDQEALAKLPVVGEADPMSAQIAWMTGGAVDEKTVRRIMSVLMALVVEIGAGFGAMIAIRAVGAVLNEEDVKEAEKSNVTAASKIPQTELTPPQARLIAPSERGSRGPAYRRQIGEGTPLGNDIRELLRKLGSTQEALAQRLGASAQTVHSWASGRRVPEEPYISKINDLRREAGLIC